MVRLMDAVDVLFVRTSPDQIAARMGARAKSSALPVGLRRPDWARSRVRVRALEKDCVLYSSIAGCLYGSRLRTMGSNAAQSFVFPCTEKEVYGKGNVFEWKGMEAMGSKAGESNEYQQKT